MENGAKQSTHAHVNFSKSLIPAPKLKFVRGKQNVLRMKKKKKKIRRDEMNERKLLPKKKKKVRIRCSGRRSCRKNDGKKFSKEDINTCMRYAPIVTDSQNCDTDKNVYINTYMRSPCRKSRVVNDENTHNSENGGVAFNDAHRTYMRPPKIYSHTFGSAMNIWIYVY